MGFHERAQEVLAGADHYRSRASRRVDRIDAGIGGRAFYLHSVLKHELNSCPAVVAKYFVDRQLLSEQAGK